MIRCGHRTYFRPVKIIFRMRPILTAFVLLIGLSAPAQNYQDIMELLQMDLRTEKDTIVMASLALTGEQRALFMPVYNEYNAAMKKHWEDRLALVDDVAASRDRMDDDIAAALMHRLSALDTKTITLRDTYAKKLEKVLPTTIAARWVQVERRLNQLFELQIANEVPLVPGRK
jgi:hypothetical protein